VKPATKIKEEVMYKAILVTILFVLPGSAHAELLGIIDEYCTELAQATEEAVRELGNASRDLGECVDEFDDCLGGLFDKDPVKCIRDYGQCIQFGNNDLNHTCTEFLHEFRRETKQAERKADREDVEDEFLLWIQSEHSDVCLAPAVDVAVLCAGIVID
jgi:hypothetical protein